jgi:hypothetical protein
MVDIMKYDFSYTASSLRYHEMILVANSKSEEDETALVRDFGNGKSATGKRILRECRKRLSTLTTKETVLLNSSDLITQKQIAFLAICKVHGFIRDFVVEVLREKLLVFDYHLSEGEYISFMRRKMEIHQEMENLTESSLKKIKQVTFKILEQAGLIDNIKSRLIQAQIIDNKLTKAIVADDEEWLKVFLLSDLDIINLNR